jgi:hypothetical protein
MLRWALILFLLAHAWMHLVVGGYLRERPTIGSSYLAPFDVVLAGSPTVRIAGPVWVEGNITLDNSPIIRIDESVGSKSVAIIADNPSNRLTSSRIFLDFTGEFQGSGEDNTYILMLSQNESAALGGTVSSINVENQAKGEFLVYAGRGQILLRNNVTMREVTAYRVRAEQSAEVIYETGMARALFTSGPGGGYALARWREVQ